jgi:hypothetical protein
MKKKFRETKLNFCETKRNFASIIVVRNEMKFRIFLFHETSEIFAKQARLSYRFVFREINKKAKIKNPSLTISRDFFDGLVLASHVSFTAASWTSTLPHILYFLSTTSQISTIVCFDRYKKNILIEISLKKS